MSGLGVEPVFKLYKFVDRPMGGWSFGIAVSGKFASDHSQGSTLSGIGMKNAAMGIGPGVVDFVAASCPVHPGGGPGGGGAPITNEEDEALAAAIGGGGGGLTLGVRSLLTLDGWD